MRDILPRLAYSRPLCSCLTKTHETKYHDELCAYRVSSDAEDAIMRLRLALDVALKFHAPFMPGDSRAVPDWFVACAAVQCDISSNEQEVEDCLRAALKLPDMTREEAVESLTEQLTISFDEELVCVNAHDRCQGSFPCPYCEVK